MSGYLTRWREIEDSPVGRILKAISQAGDFYHDTERWSEDDPKRDLLGESMMDMIERVVRGEVAALQEKVDVGLLPTAATPRAEGHRRIMACLAEIMKRAPMLRVCQIVGNAIPAEVLQRRKNDIYYIEDDELLGYLRIFEKFLVDQDGRAGE